MIPPSSLAKLVVGYLEEEGLHKTVETFYQEYKKPYTEEGSNPFVKPPNLRNILEDYVALKESEDNANPEAVVPSLWRNLDVLIGQLKYHTIPQPKPLNSQKIKKKKFYEKVQNAKSVSTTTTRNKQQTSTRHTKEGVQPVQSLVVTGMLAPSGSPSKWHTVRFGGSNLSTVNQESSIHQKPVEITTRDNVRSPGLSKDNHTIPISLDKGSTNIPREQNESSSDHMGSLLLNIDQGSHSQTSNQSSMNSKVGFTDIIDKRQNTSVSIETAYTSVSVETTCSGVPRITIDNESIHEVGNRLLTEGSGMTGMMVQDTAGNDAVDISFKSPKRKGNTPRKRHVTHPSPTKILPQDSYPVEVIELHQLLDEEKAVDAAVPLLLDTFLNTPLLQEKLAENINKVVGWPSDVMEEVITEAAEKPSTSTENNYDQHLEIPVDDILSLLEADPAFETLLSMLGNDGSKASPVKDSQSIPSFCSSDPTLISKTSPRKDSQSTPSCSSSEPEPTCSNLKLMSCSESQSAISLVTESLLMLSNSPSKVPASTTVTPALKTVIPTALTKPTAEKYPQGTCSTAVVGLKRSEDTEIHVRALKFSVSPKKQPARPKKVPISKPERKSILSPSKRLRVSKKIKKKKGGVPLNTQRVLQDNSLYDSHSNQTAVQLLQSLATPLSSLPSNSEPELSGRNGNGSRNTAGTMLQMLQDAAAMHRVQEKRQEASILSGHVTSNLPGQVNSNLPSQVTRNLPGQITSNLPGQVLNNLPGLVTSNLPGQIATNLPGQVSKNLPGQVASNLPGQVSKHLPGQVTSNLPGQVSNYLPHQVASNLPGQATSNLPGQIASNLPGQVTSNLPGQVLSNLSGQEGNQLMFTQTDNGNMKELQAANSLHTMDLNFPATTALMECNMQQLGRNPGLNLLPQDAASISTEQQLATTMTGIVQQSNTMYFSSPSTCVPPSINTASLIPRAAISNALPPTQDSLYSFASSFQPVSVGNQSSCYVKALTNPVPPCSRKVLNSSSPLPQVVTSSAQLITNLQVNTISTRGFVSIPQQRPKVASHSNNSINEQSLAPSSQPDTRVIGTYSQRLQEYPVISQQGHRQTSYNSLTNALNQEAPFLSSQLDDSSKSNNRILNEFSVDTTKENHKQGTDCYNLLTQSTVPAHAPVDCCSDNIQLTQRHPVLVPKPKNKRLVNSSQFLHFSSTQGLVSQTCKPSRERNSHDIKSAKCPGKDCSKSKIIVDNNSLTSFSQETLDSDVDNISNKIGTGLMDSSLRGASVDQALTSFFSQASGLSSNESSPMSKKAEDCVSSFCNISEHGSSPATIQSNTCISTVNDKRSLSRTESKNKFKSNNDCVRKPSIGLKFGSELCGEVTNQEPEVTCNSHLGVGGGEGKESHRRQGQKRAASPDLKIKKSKKSKSLKKSKAKKSLPKNFDVDKFLSRLHYVEK